MKKLFAALALCVSTVASAQDAKTETETETKTEKRTETKTENPQAPSAQQGSRQIELFEATELRSQTPGSATSKAAKEKERKDAEGIGGSGDTATVTDKAKDAVGLDENDEATGGSGTTEMKKETKTKAKETKTKAKETGEDAKGMASDAAHDTKNATKDAAHDTENAAKDAKNKADQEMNQ